MQTAQVMGINIKHTENKIHGSKKKTSTKMLKIYDQEYERIKEIM
jgi:hypothetical protein